MYVLSRGGYGGHCAGVCVFIMQIPARRLDLNEILYKSPDPN